MLDEHKEKLIQTEQTWEERSGYWAWAWPAQKAGSSYTELSSEANSSTQQQPSAPTITDTHWN